MSSLLDAPCIFCGYNGPDYWQIGSHNDDCPFYHTATIELRADMFRKMNNLSDVSVKCMLNAALQPAEPAHSFELQLAYDRRGETIGLLQEQNEALTEQNEKLHKWNVEKEKRIAELQAEISDLLPEEPEHERMATD